MQKKNSEDILLKYQLGQANEEEKAALENWVMHGIKTDFDLSDQELLGDLKEIRQRLEVGQPNRNSKTKFFWFAAAASILIVLTLGTYFISKKPAEGLHFVQKKNVPIVPGGKNATLTLADGSKIELTGSANGNIAHQAGVSINKTKEGELIYTLANPNGIQTPPVYNHINTPNGGQYEVTLPDGTKVWLNAASSLKYPTYFSGKERKVQLDGEAYFEVKKDKKMPFLVVSGNATVEVLGTHFNIKAYKGEAVLKTTLLEGSVRLSSQKNSAVLVPGQQAVLSYQEDQIRVANVKTAEAVAWKNGYFMFKETNLRDMMNQISRWYDVEIDYQCDTRKKSFGGVYSKTKDINELLKALELTKAVHFKIEGRRIIVKN